MERPTPEKEAMARQMDAGHEATPERAEEALPELKLIELQRSEKPINTVERGKAEIERIVPWNNYTIFILCVSVHVR